MIATLLGVGAVVWAAAAVLLHERGALEAGPYPAPDDAQDEVRTLAAAHPARCRLEEIGRSREGRPLLALRLRGAAPAPGETRPRLLVTAQIHAVEYVGSLVARAVARALVEGWGSDAAATRLLDAADVWIVPLLNPDGAQRVWRKRGFTALRGARVTSSGVDPNRNFPFAADAGGGGSAARRGGGRPAWNAASTRPGSAYYRGPHPLSEPECAALARLAARLRPCAAVNFHSVGAVVYLPAEAPVTHPAFDVFRGAFQARQRHRAYAPRPQSAARTRGELDPFLWQAFGAPSVTIEVSRPAADVLLPWFAPRLFWWANPPDPRRWLENDVSATIAALRLLLERTQGRAETPARPGLWDQTSPDTTAWRTSASDEAS